GQTGKKVSAAALSARIRGQLRTSAEGSVCGVKYDFGDDAMLNNSPESMARSVIERCADCDVCRYLMEDTSCLVFPEIYRLFDKEVEKKGSITCDELKSMVELCNFCALCPCPNVRSDLMKAKNAFIERDGMKPSIRFLEDVEYVATVCGAYPRLSNVLLRNGLTGRLIKRVAGIHAERNFPAIPKENFPAWVQKRGLDIRRETKGRKVAYFTGCTGRYLFPDVPIAAVNVLKRNGVEVNCPELKCCGMPSLLEGDRDFTLKLAAFNVERLCEAVESGYDIVCSCPTCGYMLKSVFGEVPGHAAIFSQPETGRKSIADGREIIGKKIGARGKTIFNGLFRDEGYFASIDPRKRIEVSSHTYDLGEYLRGLHLCGELDTCFGSVAGTMAYYPPCHLREQNIGEPWFDLLRLVPATSLEKIDGSFHCCGIAGIMGFKRDFHEVSVKMGSRLVERIEAIDPERLLTDCLSCRLQFNQLTPYRPNPNIRATSRNSTRCC
ncbi:MAG: heterodisulfide reductase-related iron-sulfur binding cluster, partial [Syntrophobacteraceae bacterium]